MATPSREASTTVSRSANAMDIEITPAYCCYHYSICTILLFLVPLILVGLTTLFIGNSLPCYLELFAHSVSVSISNANANVSTADWRIGLIAKSPVTGCKISLHTVKSRLLRGDDVISELTPSLDGFGNLVTSATTDEPVITVDFKTVVTPGVIGGVVWDYSVEIVAGVKAESRHGFVMVFCGDIPVKFTADPAGNMIGSLLGSMRRCDYLLRDNLIESSRLHLN